MKTELEKDIQELTKIYPKVVSIVNNWQQFFRVHGIKQTPEEEKILQEYVKILKKLGVLK